MTEKPLLKSMVSERIWSLMDTDPDAFRAAVQEHFARGYPGWTVVRAKYPFIYLRDDRERIKRGVD